MNKVKLVLILLLLTPVLVLANGSLQADKSRGIAYITYDYNNNPKQIYFTNGRACQGTVTWQTYTKPKNKMKVFLILILSTICGIPIRRVRVWLTIKAKWIQYDAVQGMPAAMTRSRMASS